MKKQQPDYSTKTICIKLDVPEEEKPLLLETFRQFSRAVSFVVEAGWNEDGRKDYSKTSLHDKTYYDVRDLTDLPANLVVQARNRAADQIKRCVVEFSNDGRATKPSPKTYGSVVYDSRTISVHDRHCTIATVDGRRKFEYLIGDFQKRHLDNPNYEWRSSTLNYRKDSGEFFLNLTIRKTTRYRRGHRVLGVDLGITNLAVTSTGQFYSGDQFSWHKDRYFEKRRSLQRKGTRSASRTLKQMSERENRFSLDYLHCVSKSVVDEAIRNDCAFIALEDLNGIRNQAPKWMPRQKRRLHQWAFHTLKELITYKARERGIRVLFVNPHHTSQRCSRCGHISPSNRSGSNFQCQECGYSLNADYNAAKNIGLRALSLPEGKSPSGLGNGQLALKSGTLTPSSSTVYRSYDQAA